MAIFTCHLRQQVLYLKWVLSYCLHKEGKTMSYEDLIYHAVGLLMIIAFFLMTSWLWTIIQVYSIPATETFIIQQTAYVTANNAIWTSDEPTPHPRGLLLITRPYTIDGVSYYGELASVAWQGRNVLNTPFAQFARNKSSYENVLQACPTLVYRVGIGNYEIWVPVAR